MPCSSFRVIPSCPAATPAWPQSAGSYEQWFELMPQVKFTIQYTAVEDIFALTATNNAGGTHDAIVIWSGDNVAESTFLAMACWWLEEQ